MAFRNLRSQRWCRASMRATSSWFRWKIHRFWSQKKKQISYPKDILQRKILSGNPMKCPFSQILSGDLRKKNGWNWDLQRRIAQPSPLSSASCFWSSCSWRPSLFPRVNQLISNQTKAIPSGTQTWWKVIIVNGKLIQINEWFPVSMFACQTVCIGTCLPNSNVIFIYQTAQVANSIT